MAALLRQARPHLKIVSLPPVPALASGCPSPVAVASEEMLPLKHGAFDLVTSALALQFANDLPGALVQIRCALKPDGLFVGALLGGDTLAELRHAFTIAETELLNGVSPRVFPTAQLQDVGALLQRAGFALPVADSEVLTVTYPSALALMNEIRAMGAANALRGRLKTTLRRDVLARTVEVYTELFGMGDKVKATFEILYLCGWAPHESQQKPLRPGAASVSLAEALKGGTNPSVRSLPAAR
jgi:SAM-dependent methyltransferase